MIRRWPNSQITPPEGWVVNPELSRTYGQTIIVSSNEDNNNRVEQRERKKTRGTGRALGLAGLGLAGSGIISAVQSRR
jgi:hypothetical protein